MLKRLASFFTYLMRHYLPDAYLFAILLTFLSAILALIFTSVGFTKVITTWGDGIYGIIAFAFQMILILVTGHCLALTPAVNRILVWFAKIGDTPVKGGMIVAFVAGICSFINWGFGLVVGGLLALQVAKGNRKADFPYLIAAAYSGFVVWHMGLSGSIPLVIATSKHAQNFIEKMTGSNIVIFIFFIAGVILHGKPVNYIKAMNTAIKGAGGIALQFPLYGGIQGIMIGTGLAKVIAGWFVALSTAETFYMFQFWAAGIINMFIPSGGGQWAAQGPITMEAAKMMGIDPIRSAMMVAWGDQWTNMIQPFWALPLLGLAGLSARDIMGYTTVTLLYSGLVLSIFALLVGFGIL